MRISQKKNNKKKEKTKQKKKKKLCLNQKHLINRRINYKLNFFD